MGADRTRVTRRWQIVWAIALKDIVDALRNRTILTMILGLSLFMLTNQALPLILMLNPVPKAVVYDPNRSDLMQKLIQEEGFSLRRVSELEEMETWVAEASEVVLGLSMPAEIDVQVAAGAGLELEASVAYWAEPTAVSELVTFFEGELSQAAGRPVDIEGGGNIVYAQPDSGGRPFMVSMGFVMVTILAGAFLVPHLMLEEKEAFTIEALLVSPANYTEVVLGKALAGLFYCLAAEAVFFAFNLPLINHWGPALLAAFSGALFAVAIGLLMGILFDNPANMNLWLGVMIMMLLIPVFLVTVSGPNIPAVVRAVIPWFPSSAMAKLFQISFTDVIPTGVVWANLGTLIVSALLILALVVWRVRLLDRKVG